MIAMRVWNGRIVEFGSFSGYSSRRGLFGRHSLLTGSVIAMNFLSFVQSNESGLESDAAE